MFAFASAKDCLADDVDMPILLSACRDYGLSTQVCFWDDPSVDWSCFDAVILRSTWNYSERLSDFLSWCESVASVTRLCNPLSVVRWCLDKHYLLDLDKMGVPVVPSKFIEPGMAGREALHSFLSANSEIVELVVKPAVGCYSNDVQRFRRTEVEKAEQFICYLLEKGSSAILQPYFSSVDTRGETNLVFFDGSYSHAIRKDALLLPDGTANVPTYDFRSARDAEQDERDVAATILHGAESHLRLGRPLVYARVDLIRDDDGKPRLLELDIAEPSLNLAFCDAAARRFAESLVNLKKRSN